ncbi:DUF6150 family protein [Candidatus Spyradosoma sp. SGI.093]|uniref:DUF6150 family protein n=1 Tax=Candidatus Spyradosoma sp. SGI.093 TaxID=3420583 RepID=UPI003CFFE302
MFSSAWSQAARFEDAATRLAPLIGGLEQSKALCEELRDQAANGTQSFEQLASVAGRLASVFKSTDNVRRWTKAFHDISAGTGFALAEVVFLLKLGGRRLKVMVMKKIFAFLLLLCSTFVLTGAKAPDSPVMRGGRFYKDECERIWKECYGKISVTQNRSEARYWVFVEKNKSDAKLLISLCDKYRASKPGRWFLSTDPYGIKIAFVQSWLEADITVAFVPEGQERFNWR